jgi:hypothetical protein
VTSLETIDEAVRGDPVKAKERLQMLKDLPLLVITPEVQKIARELIDLSIVPHTMVSDSVHIAVAAIHRVDYLITWNFKHIANPMLREKIRSVLLDKGYRMPVMTSPHELLI